MYKPITHVIYDLDGLLLDTESLHERVNREMARRYGKIFDLSLKLEIAGRPTLDSATIIVDLLKLPITPETYLEERKKLLYPLYPQARPLPGAIRLTNHLYRQKIPQGIATSSSSHHFEMKTTHHREWLRIFDCWVLGDDPELKRGKPAPDIFLLAAQRLGATAEQCLVFEDSLAGMEAAKKAGMAVVAIPHPDFDRELYRDADQILTCLSEFQPQLWHLPNFV